MMTIDAALANAGSTVPLKRMTERTNRSLDDVLSLLHAHRPFPRADAACAPNSVHVLAWSHDGLYGGMATHTGLWLKTPRGNPFDLEDLLEIRLFTPGLELYGRPDESDRSCLAWQIHQETDPSGWSPTMPILFDNPNRTDGVIRCLTTFHHVFGTRLHGPSAEHPLHLASPTLGAPGWNDFSIAADSMQDVRASFWLLEEHNRGIRWAMSADALERKNFDTRRVRHSWGEGANLFLAVRNYLRTSPKDGSLSTLSTCLGGYWRLGDGDRMLEEVRPA